MVTVLMVRRGRSVREFEAESVVVDVSVAGVIDLVLDDGERLRFVAGELRAAVDAPRPVGGVADVLPPDGLSRAA